MGEVTFHAFTYVYRWWYWGGKGYICLLLHIGTSDDLHTLVSIPLWGFFHEQLSNYALFLCVILFFALTFPSFLVFHFIWYLSFSRLTFFLWARLLLTVSSCILYRQKTILFLTLNISWLNSKHISVKHFTFVRQ